jgi:hyperosmotically inducible periplasmic protein
MNHKTHKSIGALITLISVMTGMSSLQAANDTDNRIEAAFKNSLVYNSYLTDPGETVNIRSDRSAVTLTGTVTNKADKSLAEATASNIPGVKKVDNKIQIIGEHGDADTWIATKVKSTLMFHRNVSGMGTSVDVKHGVVTLKGKADTQAQSDLTAKYAQDVDGVKEVKNEIVVAESTEKSTETVSTMVDDASITAQVNMALLFHRSTSALRTDINSKEGVVTVRGKAKNMAEKELVTEIVSDIKGVKNVVNKMTIVTNPQG